MTFRAAMITAMLLATASAHVAAVPIPASIGAATMTADGTIRLQLRAEGKNGEIGDAVITYRRGDPMYDDVLRHIGGIKPGEDKPVPPWPDVHPAHTR